MTEILPPSRDDKPSNGNGGNYGGGDRFLAINHLHLHGNDLAELRKLAEVSPHLAEKVVDQRDREDARANVSYRFGLAASLVLVALTLTCVTTLLVFVGLLPTILVIALILAVSLLVRVVLTGQWSDTTWFGKLVGLLAKALGSTSEKDDKGDKE